jgi:hypothetical protein
MDPVPEAILDRRLVKKGNSATAQGLIKWETIPAEAATWEDLSNLKKRFPSFDAWGQASASEEGSVTPGLCHTGEATEEMQTRMKVCVRVGPRGQLCVCVDELCSPIQLFVLNQHKNKGEEMN